MAKQSSATKRKLQAAFHEVKHNEPAIVAKTRKKEGSAKAEKQKVAIALSKARAAGANIPEKDTGGPIGQTGIYKLEKGERVIPANTNKDCMSAPRMSETGSPEDYKPTYGDPKVSTSNDVAFEKAPRLGATQGILKDQPRTHGNNYPGRAVPPTQPVTQATVKSGVAKKASEKELQELRQPLNTHDRVEGHY